MHGDLESAFARFWQDSFDRYRLVRTDPERPVLAPEALFLSAEQFYGLANRHAQLALRAGAAAEGEPAFIALPDLAVQRGADEPWAKLQAHLQRTPHRLLLLAESEGRRESLIDLLRTHHAMPAVFDSFGF